MSPPRLGCSRRGEARHCRIPQGPPPPAATGVHEGLHEDVSPLRQVATAGCCSTSCLAGIPGRQGQQAEAQGAATTAPEIRAQQAFRVDSRLPYSLQHSGQYSRGGRIGGRDRTRVNTLERRSIPNASPFQACDSTLKAGIAESDQPVGGAELEGGGQIDHVDTRSHDSLARKVMSRFFRRGLISGVARRQPGFFASPLNLEVYARSRTRSQPLAPPVNATSHKP